MVAQSPLGFVFGGPESVYFEVVVGVGWSNLWVADSWWAFLVK